MFRHFICIGVLVLAAVSAQAQAPDTLWTKTFGGAGADWGMWVEETPDSGLIIVGYTASFGAGSRDCYIIRLTAAGDSGWAVTQGGIDREEAAGICFTDDGGYLVGGFSGSYAPNGFDFHLVNLTDSGTVDWYAEYGGADTADYMTTMCRTADGDYVLTGHDSNSETDFYTVKVDSGGAEIWTRRHDLPGSPEPGNIAPTADSGFIVTGDAGAYLVRYSAAGDTLWHRTYGGGLAEARSVVALADGGFAVLGARNFGAPQEDFWFLRLDAGGDTLWTRHYGNNDPDYGYCLQQTFDGGFILAGHHYPPGQNRNVWLVRINAAGDTLWTKSIGGTGSDYGYCVQQTSDSGYVIVGHTNSSGGGGDDVYVIRLAPDRASSVGIADDGVVQPDDFALGQNYPNPFNAGTRIDYSLSAAGPLTITIYNTMGRRVRVLRNRITDAGRGYVIWDGRDEAGLDVASGLYLYRLETKHAASTRKMVLLR